MTALTGQAHGDRGASAEAEFTVKIITIIVGVTAALAFLFGFGNCWALGLRLGVPGWIAPLVGPAVDLSVVGLLLARRFLALHGVSGAELVPIKRMLIASCVATLALNVAEPILAGQYGTAAFDSTGPLLLMAWSETGPGLLAAIRRVPVHNDSSDGEPNSATTVMPVSRRFDDTPDEEDLLQAARGADARYWREHHRPIPADKLRKQLGISTARARALVRSVRDEHPTATPRLMGRERMTTAA